MAFCFQYSIAAVHKETGELLHETGREWVSTQGTIGNIDPYNKAHDNILAEFDKEHGKENYSQFDLILNEDEIRTG